MDGEGGEGDGKEGSSWGVFGEEGRQLRPAAGEWEEMPGGQGDAGPDQRDGDGGEEGECVGEECGFGGPEFDPGVAAEEVAGEEGSPAGIGERCLAVVAAEEEEREGSEEGGIGEE